MPFDAVTGLPASGTGATVVSVADSLASVGKTIGGALGIGKAQLDGAIGSGQLISAAIGKVTA